MAPDLCMTLTVEGEEVPSLVPPSPAEVARGVLAHLPAPQRVGGCHVLSADETASLVKACVEGIASTGVPAADGWMVCGVDSVTWASWWRRGLAELGRWSQVAPEHTPSHPAPAGRAASSRAAHAPTPSAMPPRPPASVADPAEVPYALLVWACERAAAVTETMAWSVLTWAARQGKVSAAERVLDRHAARRDEHAARQVSHAAGSGSEPSAGLVVSTEALNRLLDYFGGRAPVEVSSEPVIDASSVPVDHASPPVASF